MPLLRFELLRSYPADMAPSPLSPDEFRAAAEVYREMGPEYRDAVAESFIAKVNTEIAAQISAQLARTTDGSRPAGGPHADRVPMPRVMTGALITSVPLVWVLIVMYGSAAARADWYQWLLGALVVTAALTAASTVVRKTHVHSRLAR